MSPRTLAIHRALTAKKIGIPLWVWLAVVSGTGGTTAVKGFMGHDDPPEISDIKGLEDRLDRQDKKLDRLEEKMDKGFDRLAEKMDRKGR